MDNKPMNHGSLFSGIGGFDLAAEWMGWNNTFHCEWMPFPRKILNYYWPNSISYEDITKTDFTIHKRSIDILTGGFPCQPYSAAGKRLGKDDERHLWPEMLRAIKEIEPRWIVGENVRGLTNWNGGVVFEEVCADLENCGYQVQPVLLPACAIGAPHRRDRIWFIAYSKTNGCKLQSTTNKSTEYKQERSEIRTFFKSNGNEWTITDTNSNGFDQCDSEYEKQSGERRFNGLDDINENDVNVDAADSKFKRLQSSTINGRLFDKEEEMVGKRNKSTIEPSTIYSKQIAADTNSTSSQCWDSQTKKEWKKQSGRIESFSKYTSWEIFPTESPVCGGDDGISIGLDGITFSKWRAESIKGYGNAVVPQLVYQIFKVIQHMDNEQT